MKGFFNNLLRATGACLGLALCDVVEGASPEAAEAIINDLIEVLGEDHDRIAKARDNVEKALAT